MKMKTEPIEKLGYAGSMNKAEALIRNGYQSGKYLELNKCQ